MTTTYASYERTITVETYSYTATVVTESGETTGTLVVRQDPDRHQYRQIACPKCHGWMPMHWNGNVQEWLPVHCTGCVLGLYDIHYVPAPAVVTEPAAVEEALPVASEVEELGSLNFELDPNKATLTAMEYTMATPEQIAAWRAAREAIEQDVLIAKLTFEDDAVVDRARHVAIREGKYVLWVRRSDNLAVDCSCPSRVKRNRLAGKACKHQMAHNATLKTAEAA